MRRDMMYDWVIVGGGAAGIAIAEILSRLGLSTLILEKNEKLAVETTGVFHEWFHTGVMYTLSKKSLETSRFLLGSLDDLLTYYDSYSAMNLLPAELGFNIDGPGWFNSEFINIKYRNRPTNLSWSTSIARSAWYIDRVKKNDFMRKRAGCILDDETFGLQDLAKHYPLSRDEFIEVPGPDFTMNSRNILADLLVSALSNGSQVVTGCEVQNIDTSGSETHIKTSSGNFKARRVAICSAGGLKGQQVAHVNYAPMIVYKNLAQDAPSFVELDAQESNCINLINKGNGYGLAGGISLPSLDQVPAYLNHCLALQKQRNPQAEIVDTYIGEKRELLLEGEKRNYLFHINEIDTNVMNVVLGKFTLMFSMAPEFVRRVYKHNPPTSPSNLSSSHHTSHPLVGNTRWMDILIANGETPNGHDQTTSQRN